MDSFACGLAKLQILIHTASKYNAHLRGNWRDILNEPQTYLNHFEKLLEPGAIFALDDPLDKILSFVETQVIDPAWYFKLGIELIKQQEFELGSVMLKKVLTIDPHCKNFFQHNAEIGRAHV